MRQVTYRIVALGCDPEFFFARKSDGSIVGAEKVLNKTGNSFSRSGINAGKIIIDGVQAEINPRPNHCRANLANDIMACFHELKKTVGSHKDLKVDFAQTVKISKDELATLDEKSRKFGCAPSKNSHNAEAKITVNAEDYPYRSAGGHIHLGHTGPNVIGDQWLRQALTTPEKLVPLLDTVLGTIGVLVDRGNDEANRERRKVYGRAGEYRTPAHGLEYRTLSNFWLKSYPIMSMVFGVARNCVNLIADDMHHEHMAKTNPGTHYAATWNKEGSFYDAFMSKVKIENVVKAINESDFDLALENWNKIEKLWYEVMGTYNSENFPLNKNVKNEFEYFVQKTYDDPNHWFKQDPLEHWTTIGEGHTGGFYDFLAGPVRTQLSAHKLKEAKDKELLKQAVKKAAA